MQEQFTSKYFSIIQDHFDPAFKIAQDCEFNREKYRPILAKIFSQKLALSMMDSLYDALAEIDWNGQENNTKRLAGLKVTYTGSEYGYKRHINSTTEFLSKVALYADTIILEDQIFHQLTRSPENVPMVMQEFYTIADFAN
jgi:hypothetical protein